ncbi:MAG: LysM peptidoglycan-binding domain-containing protein, partial [Candidatus Latescibacteria bacterium]|nr:LysM peptidoglycan-binding domain-containing protein [Candidatus Latescibacterota bacterium]
ETLWSISLLYGMSLTELRRANNMRSRASAIQPGQRLRVRPRGTS